MRRILLLLAAAGVVAAQTTTPPPFAIKIQQGTTVSLVSDGATLTLPSDGIGIPSDGLIALTYTGTGLQTAAINTVTVTGTTDFSVSGLPDLPYTVVPTSNTISMRVRYLPTSSKQANGKVIIGYSEPGKAPGTITINLAGTAPELVFTSTIQPNGSAVPLANGAAVTLPQVAIDETSSTLVAVMNRGSGPGVVNGISIRGSEQFSLAGVPVPPATIDPGKDLKFTVRYTPKRLEPLSATVRIDLVNNTSLSFTVTGSGTGSVMEYEVLSAGGAFTPIDPGDLITVPDAVVNSDKTTATVRVWNTGNAEARITAISASGNGFSIVEAPFVPYTLAAGGAITFKVQFQPTQPGRVAGRLRVGNDNFELQANGLGSNLIYSYSAGGVQLPVQSGATLVFPSAAVGATSRLSFTIKNDGTAPTGVNSIVVTGTGTTFTLADAPAVPLRLAPGASYDLAINFAPTAVGNATGSLKIDTQTFTLSATANPPQALSDYRFEGSSGTVQAQQQPSIGLTLAQPYPLALTGTLTLVFTPEVFANDPAVQFATGGRTVNFTIPAGSTQAVFANNASQVKIQTGSVAGTVSLTPSFQTQTGAIDLTPANPLAVTMTIPQSAPQLLSVALSSKTTSGFTLLVTGYATGRSITQMDFNFTPTANENVSTTKLSLNVDASFTAWFNNSQSNAFGSLFTATVPFTLQGDLNKVSNLADTIQSVSVTLTNRQGTSSAKSVDLR